MKIAYLTTFKNIVGLTRDSYSEENDQVLQRRFSGIRQHMGRDYGDAVTACISGEFRLPKHDDENWGDKGTFGVSWISQQKYNCVKQILQHSLSKEQHKAESRLSFNGASYHHVLYDSNANAVRGARKADFDQ